MEKDQKILATKYMFYCFTQWYDPTFQNDNDLSLLKALKLIFFTCSISTKHTDNLLSRGFSFVAMPFGHVESQIYDYYKSGEFNGIIDTKHITSSSLTDDIFNELDQSLKALIFSSVQDLCRKNQKLINESASALVNLSHKHSSWIINFKVAKVNGFYSTIINNEEIINEEKFYFV